MRRITILAFSLALLLIAAPTLAGWEQGVAAFDAKDFSLAAAEFSEIVEQDPSFWRAHYKLGLSLEKLGRNEEALSALRKADGLNPGDVYVALALGRAYYATERYGAAADSLGGFHDTSIPNAHRAEFFQLRGRVRMRMGNPDGAVGDLEKWARLKPNDAEAQYQYGIVAFSVGKSADAIYALGRATRLAPGDEGKKRAYAEVLFKNARTVHGADAKAEYARAATVAGELVAKSPTYHNLLLKLRAELGAESYVEAIETGKTAVSKKGDDWLGHFYLGQAYERAGQYPAAESPLMTAVQKAKKPEDLKQVWRQLGYVYEKQKRYSDAIEAYRQAGDQNAMARVALARQNTPEKQDEETRAMNDEIERQLKALEGGGGR